MSSQGESFSQRTAFHTAGSRKPIEVNQQSLARVAQILGAVAKEEDDTKPSEYENEFDGDEVDDDLVFSTVPQRSLNPTTTQIHFDEIDDDEMRRFAESFEQEQQDVKMDDNNQLDDNEDDIDDDADQLCEDYALKMQTPTKSVHIENKKRKEPCIEDLDALLNDDDSDSNENNEKNQMEQQQQMSPVFKKKL
ncbi:unnamed protein product [Adineta steineri]|uniref:Uncharacterized protein n=1 Tax=Adineta steineri TaxID=433720 RepID=A0A814HR72_9BILA|nr:unnamed protein product [Adineta steineri]CAF0752737.1 unnamed protein product [Adineta steineri]CAF0838248.1 unnamed protein product [Adineta steineri]CAF1013752.1 unnamed protein product [Adineta steineri]CAF3525901.1 unnamed protein product [Adineta steineri]